jgi:hypothetical protein
MIMLYKRMIAAVMVSVVLLPAVASAEGLLGGVLGGGEGSGLLGGGDIGGLVTLESGNAGTSGLVNVGIGGSEGLVTANVGANEPVIGAQVLGPQGIVDVDLDLGDVGANVNVGGPNLIDVDLDLPNGGNGGDGGNGGNGGNGSGGNGPGGNGNNGSNGSNGADGRSVFASGNSSGALTAACAGYTSNQLLALFNQSTIQGWNRANGIQLIPIRVCADLRRQIANWLAGNGDCHRLLGAVAQDPLVNAALGRTQYRPGHVLGVHRQGSTLMVYVF